MNPLPGGDLYHRPIEGARATAHLEGKWTATPDGYVVTLGLSDPLFERLWAGSRIGFDLLVNEMRPGRMRRAGQLVWSGGNGWIYLRGDRQDPASFGLLELG